MGELTIVQVPIADLKEAEYNPRQANEQEYAQLKQSLTRFGFVEPLVVNTHKGRENVLVGGHFRIRVAKDLGMATVPVVYVDLDEAQERELNLRLNKNNGEWDFDKLAAFDMVLLHDVGFTVHDLHALPQPEAHEDGFVPAVPEQPKAARGDLYQLGSHRLLCGDATSVADMDKLLDGAKADMVFTDPPYNVDYTGGTKDKLQMLNDHRQDFALFLTAAFRNMIEHCAGALYICMSSSEWPTLQQMFVEVGGYWSRTIIWVKDRFVLSRGDYHTQFEPILNVEPAEEEGEPILYGWKVGVKHAWNGDRKQSDVWRIERPSANREHPTMKPILLCAKAIQNSSTQGQLVLDCFGGSGSTLIACEQLGRRCAIMELDPRYVDVIVARWEKETGKKAVKVDKPA